MAKSEEIYRGRKITLYREECTMPDGKTATFDLVRHPGAVVMLPMTETGQLYLVKQYRFAVEETIFEFPAGTLEPGEEPLSAAQRELEEEIGMSGSDWRDLGKLYPTPGFCDELQYCYFVSGLTPKKRPLDEDEYLEPVLMSVGEVQALVRDDRMRDGKSLAIFLKAMTAGYLSCSDR